MNSQTTWDRAVRRSAAGLLCALGLSGISCTRQNQENPATQALRQVIAAYEKASRYADSGEVHVRATKTDGTSQESKPIPFSVTYERPNKLRLHAQRVIIVCDGKLLHCTVPDRANQVLQIPAPAELTYNTLFNDPVLDRSMHENVGLPLIPLRLLVRDDPLGISADDAKPPRLLEDQDLDGVSCQRIEVERDGGNIVYWIDPETHIVKRADFPTDEVKKGLPDGIKQVEIWAEFTGAQLNEPIAAHAFEFETPSDALLLKRFLGLPPRPLPSWLGARMPPFSFTDLEGKPVTNESLAGKVVVLDLWATWCVPCMKALPDLERVYQRYKKNPQVAVLAVSIDTPDVPDSELRKLFSEKNWHVPIVRDTEDFAHKVLGIQGVPTTFMLGSNGSIQNIELGFNDKLPAELPKLLDALLAGKDLAKTAEKLFKERQENYDEQLREAFVGKVETSEIPHAEIAARSEPAALVLKKLWTADGLSQPGNLLVLDGDGSPKIVVLDGDRKIAELDGEGKVVARHDLDIPETSAVNFLRTAVDKSGQRYYLAFAAGQQQFHLFDEKWKRLLSYPDSLHAGMEDVQFADLDGDGQPAIYVGYSGAVGVQRVSLDGQRVWSNRELQNVFHLAVSAPDAEGKRALLCTNDRGSLVVLDAAGKKQREFSVQDRGLGSIVAADSTRSTVLDFCGLSAPALGKSVAIGFQADGQNLEETWTYRLPDGNHERPVETIVCAHLRDKDSIEWLLPGADGSIHILDADGQAIDQFNYGDRLTGLGWGVLGDSRALLVASSAGLTAWQVEPPKKVAAAEPAEEPAAEPDSPAEEKTADKAEPETSK